MDDHPHTHDRCPDMKTLERFASGHLDAAEHEAVSAHCAVCDACRWTVEDIRAHPEAPAPDLDMLFGSVQLAALIEMPARAGRRNDRAGKSASAGTDSDDDTSGTPGLVAMTWVRRTFDAAVVSLLDDRIALASFAVGTGKFGPEPLPVDPARIRPILEGIWHAVRPGAPLAGSRIHLAIGRGKPCEPPFGAPVDRVLEGLRTSDGVGIRVDTALVPWLPECYKGAADRSPSMGWVAMPIWRSALFATLMERLKQLRYRLEAFLGDVPRPLALVVVAAVLLVMAYPLFRGEPTSEVHLGLEVHPDVLGPADIPLRPGDRLLVDLEVTPQTVVALFLQNADQVSVAKVVAARGAATSGEDIVKLSTGVTVGDQPGTLRVLALAAPDLPARGEVFSRLAADVSDVLSRRAAQCRGPREACQKELAAAAREELVKRARERLGGRLAVAVSRPFENLGPARPQ